MSGRVQLDVYSAQFDPSDYRSPNEYGDERYNPNPVTSHLPTARCVGQGRPVAELRHGPARLADLPECRSARRNLHAARLDRGQRQEHLRHPAEFDQCRRRGRPPERERAGQGLDSRAERDQPWWRARPEDVRRRRPQRAGSPAPRRGGQRLPAEGVGQPRLRHAEHPRGRRQLHPVSAAGRQRQAVEQHGGLLAQQRPHHGGADRHGWLAGDGRVGAARRQRADFGRTCR